MRKMLLWLTVAAAPLGAATNPVTVPTTLDPAWQARSRALFQTAIEIPTVIGHAGENQRMAAFLKAEYSKAGWAGQDITIKPYKDREGGETVAFIARWPAATPTKAKPILIIAHSDVVEAKRADWVLDPFKFVEKDGYFYGRGTSDDKQGVIGTTAALFKLRAAGFKPSRDIIVFYNGDEETEGNGAALAAGEWKALTDAEFVLNADAGGGSYKADGTPLGFGIQTSEKVYQTYLLTANNRGGHSSRPRPDNAIYDLAGALQRLAAHRFEPAMTETTKAYFTVRAAQEPNALGAAMRAWVADPKDARAADAIEASELETGMTRTRCVATRLEGGHADNALPQRAVATVNCRMIPGNSLDALTAEVRSIAGPAITVVKKGEGKPSDPSPLRPDVVGAFTRSVTRLYGPMPIIPQMSTGATDGLYFRQAGIPVYGVDASWGISPDDERAHGLDERIPVNAFYNNVLHWESLIRDLAG